MTRPDYPQEGERGREARRLLSGLRGKDKSGDDDAPAVQARNAGLGARAEAAIDAENARPFGLNIAAQVIASRVDGTEYQRRH